jgi:hypothetical protein
MPQLVAPSDVLRSATDEIGDAMAVVRSQALKATGDARRELFDQYDQLLRRLQRMMFRDLKAIDEDPTISEQIEALSMLTQQIARVRREMSTAKKALDRVTQVLGFADQILRILGRVGLLA